MRTIRYNLLLEQKHKRKLLNDMKSQFQAQTGTQAQGDPREYYKAHLLYYNGIPDKYDNFGNKVKGVRPDPKKALEYLSRACELSTDPNLWLKLGSIYQNGMYNLDPDLQMARNLYIQMGQRFPGHASEIQDRINEVVTEINNINTYKWLNIKYTPKKNVHHEKIKALIKGTSRPGLFGTLLNGGATIVDRIFRATGQDQDQGQTTDVNAVGYNDRHNTHNSQVVGTVANSMKKIREGTEIKKSIPETVREIRDYIKQKPDCDRRNDALKSLDSIERNIIPITSVDMKESEALNVVWNRINSEHHKDHQEDIKDIFYQQLADMQEHGKSVCATGRLSRMVDTFSTFDKDVAIKPTYVINKEMMDKAGQIREQMYQEYDEYVANKLRAGTADPEMQDEFDKKVRTNIIETLTKDYVDTGIMTENAFVKNVEEWVDEI